MKTLITSRINDIDFTVKVNVYNENIIAQTWIKYFNFLNLKVKRVNLILIQADA